MPLAAAGEQLTLVETNVYTSASTSVSTTSGISPEHTWKIWRSQQSLISGTTNITASSTSNTLIWQNWTSELTTSTTAETWNIWVTDTAIQGLVSVPQRPILTPEQIRRDEARVRIEGERRRDARLRAEALLHERLTPSQREELRANNYFTLTVLDSKTGGRRYYQISRGRAGNVRQVDENGRRLRTLCAHPLEAVPNEDTMLTQKLWLESCEEEFLRVANHSR